MERQYAYKFLILELRPIEKAIKSVAYIAKNAMFVFHITANLSKCRQKGNYNWEK